MEEIGCLYSMQEPLRRILSMNEKTAGFGLTLTEEDAQRLAESRRNVLREQRRVEFGEEILPKLIGAFMDSPFLDQGQYVETLERLQEMFYAYKNESSDILSDDELLALMAEAFNGVCQGSLDYLEETVLDSFARDIRRKGERFLRDQLRRRGAEDARL